MEKLQNKKEINLLVILCTVVYFASYVTRLGIITTISEVIESGMATQSIASLAETLNLICYGAGQIVSGMLGDKIKPQRLIFLGLLITFAVNLAVGVGVRGDVLVFLWPLNGFAQAFMWPPMVAILAHHLDAHNYNNAVVKVSFGSSLATVLMYLLCPVIITTIGLPYVFLFAAILGVGVAFLWFFIYNRKFSYSPVAKPQEGASAAKMPPKTKFGFGVIMLLTVLMVTIALQGMLRDGVQTWTPNILMSLHGLDTSAAILSSVILPVFGFLCITFATFVQTRLIRNESLAAGIFFAVAVVCAVLLNFFGKLNMILCVALIAVIIGCAHGVNTLLVCIVPRSFVKTGKVGFVSGLLNSATYIGSALAVYIFGALGEHNDWTMVIV
ncbi:MAG: MFS transporter, partial [Oscillospiraceae bacterium]|nr:MFS transporter [Candidatus Equicaccousia limihippi]